MSVSTGRAGLLSSAAISVTGFIALSSSSAALALCDVSAETVICGTTTTTDTTNAGATPAVDRNYPAATLGAAFTGTVSNGTSINGFGLAFTNTAGGANALNVINNGVVQVDSGYTPFQGGSAAISINASNATSVNYSGTGNLVNLGTGDGLDIATTGSGSVVANVGGDVTATGPASGGIVLSSSGTGANLQLTTISGRTVRSGGVVGEYLVISNAASNGTLQLTNNASVLSPVSAPNTLATGLFADQYGFGSVTVVNSGAIGSAADRLTGFGISADILNSDSTATLSLLSGPGSIYADTGIRTVNVGSGASTVTTGGGLIAANTSGIIASGTTGSITVATGSGAVNGGGLAGIGIRVGNGSGAVSISTGGTASGGAYGIQAVSTDVQTILIGGATAGATAGIHSDSIGARTVSVGASGNVTGATQAILFDNFGRATVNNSGIIGAASTVLAINGAAASTTTVANNTGGVLNGRVTLGVGADSLINTGTFNSQGVNDFGAGADVFNNAAGGVLNILGNTTFANLETLTQNGRINLNNFTLTGSAIAFVNGSTGFIDTSSSAAIAGFTSFSNSGTLDLAAGTFTVPVAAFANNAGGVVIADEGLTTITGQTTFNNAGTIRLQDGVTGDVLTLASPYVGSGASALAIDAASFSSDRLVSGAASGSTLINVNLLDTGFISPTGQLVIDNVTSTAGAFSLGAINATPLLAYSLQQRGADYFLTAAPTLAAFEPLSLAAAAVDMWYQSADEVIAQTRLPHNNDGWAIWGKVYASRTKSNFNNDATISGVTYAVPDRTSNHRYGLQGGVDFGFGGGRFGVTGGYEYDKANSAANVRLKGWNIGAYGQFGGETGFHGEGLFKYDHYKVSVRSGAFIGNSSRGHSTGVDGALGYRFPIGNASLDANIGLSHVWTKLGDIDAFGFNYDYDKISSTRGRAGLRAVFGSSGWRPYVDATVYHESRGRGRVALFDSVNTYDLGVSNKGAWVRGEVGIGGPSNGAGSILAAWGELGDRKGVGLRLGFRFGSGHEEMPPPPPPPPPSPPPPATQTCSDGSVILASDTCPPPPLPEPEKG